MSIAHTCFNGFEANFQEPWIVILLLCFFLNVQEEQQ